VLAELNVHLKDLNYQSALLIPANPSLGRTIRDGRYYLNGTPIHETSFSIDPEFSIRSSDIQDMLHTKLISIRKPGEQLPPDSLVVGEASTTEDLHTWAKNIPENTLLAGAAGFFSAILDTRYPTVTIPAITLNKPILYVNGTTFETNRQLIREHADIYIAVDANPHHLSALQLRTQMAKDVTAILQKTAPAELIIEGGSTAYAILEHAGWHTLIPEQEFAQGVVRMSVPQAQGLHITLKPGSYAWPASIRY
jgi:uncharacterized protein YgbK (DUF1537 family)